MPCPRIQVPKMYSSRFYLRLIFFFWLIDCVYFWKQSSILKSFSGVIEKISRPSSLNRSTSIDNQNEMNKQLTFEYTNDVNIIFLKLSTPRSPNRTRPYPNKPYQSWGKVESIWFNTGTVEYGTSMVGYGISTVRFEIGTVYIVDKFGKRGV